MEIYSILASACTVISFLVFIGIVAWAYSSRRKQGFRAAAREPFALPDEADSASRPTLRECCDE
jgi:cytochrome c oxidase cbb3-type subunit IV